MAELKLKKMSWLRRRFIKSEALKSLSSWSDIYEDMKKEVLEESTFQLVGNKAIVEIDSQTDNAYVLLEVVGVPRSKFKSYDFEAHDVLVYEYPKSAFELDFLTLKKEAEGLIRGISRRLEPQYHIVFDGNHLALHFFI